MKIVARRFKPTTDKERMFRVEAEVNDLIYPGEVVVALDGNEYLIEIHREFPNASTIFNIRK